jgi:dihydroxyacid dehydratase/phosphogluconate dehydratase
MAMGCSTNAVIHIVAMARRAGHPIGLDDFDRASRKVPVIANIRPSGDTYLMEDFYYAGGLLGMLTRLTDFLDLSQINASGRTWAESLEGAEIYDDDVIRPLDKAIYQEGALAVLRGNLAPDGCVMKPSAAAGHLLRHAGPALVFDDYPDLKANIDRDDLDVTPDTVLILRNAGPLGGPGMPEWGMLPIPRKLVRQGVRDMVRISDARMSGTSYGACILHVSPESYVGGPLGLVRTGDIVTVDVPGRRIAMEVSDEELARRRAALPKAPPRYERGYGWMFSQHIGQADTGCDFDFLRTDLLRRLTEGLPCRSPTPPARRSRACRPRRSARRCSSAASRTSSSRTCTRSATGAPTWSGRPSRCATCPPART